MRSDHNRNDFIFLTNFVKSETYASPMSERNIGHSIFHIIFIELVVVLWEYTYWPLDLVTLLIIIEIRSICDTIESIFAITNQVFTNRYCNQRERIGYGSNIHTYIGTFKRETIWFTEDIG